MKPAALQLLAERQWRDYQARTPRTWFAEPNALDLDDAYRLQDAVATLRVAACRAPPSSPRDEDSRRVEVKALNSAVAAFRLAVRSGSPMNRERMAGRGVGGE